MDDDQERIKKEYAEHLKAKDYAQEDLDSWNEHPECVRFLQMTIDNLFRSGRFKGTKLLELGSAAIVYNIAAASAYFPNITMSDYVVDNIESLRKWLEGDSNLVQLLDIQAGLEGYGYNLDIGKKVLESRIRKTVKRVVRCDVLVENVLLDNSNNPDTSPPFDMIISCICLETAPKDYEGFIQILKNVGKLLKTGGGLLLTGFFQGSLWTVGGRVFNHIKIGEKELLQALFLAGFGKFDLKILKMEAFKSFNFTCEACYCIAAEKL